MPIKSDNSTIKIYKSKTKYNIKSLTKGPAYALVTELLFEFFRDIRLVATPE